MKKLICLILSLTMLLGLVACDFGSNETTTQSSTSTTESTTESTSTDSETPEKNTVILGSDILNNGKTTYIELTTIRANTTREYTLDEDDTKLIVDFLSALKLNRLEEDPPSRDGGVDIINLHYENGEVLTIYIDYYLWYIENGKAIYYEIDEIEKYKFIEDFQNLLKSIGVS